MGKNKRAAKAAWRAAATAAMHTPPVTSPAPSLVAPVIADEAPAAIDLKETTPAPTQQPRNVHAPNACPPPRTSSPASHTASACSNAARTSPSHTQPPFATTREPEAPPTATQRETRNVHRATTHPAPSTTLPASRTHVAATHNVLAHPHVPTSTRSPAKEPADTTHDAGSTYARTRPRATSPASHLPTATPHDPHTPPKCNIRPQAAENESKEGFGPREEEGRTARDAHGGEPRPVRTPAFPASRARAAAVHGMAAPRKDPMSTSPSEREPAALAAPTSTSPASRTTAHNGLRTPASPTSTPLRRAATQEAEDHRAARGDDTHDTCNASRVNTRTTTPRESSTQPRSPTRTCTATNEPAALAGARPGDTHGTRSTNALPTSRTLVAIVPDVPASTLNDGKTSAPGFEPGRAHAAAALLFEEPDGELLNPAYLKEIVATALREGHAAGLKEGRNAGFREGLEAGKKTGRAEGREEGLQEGLKQSRLEASQDTCITSPIPHPALAAAPRVSSIDAIDEQLLREIRFTAYNSGFEHGFALSDKELESAQSVGFAKGCEEESRRQQDRRPEQADAQTETTMPLTILQVDAHMQTCSPSANIPPPASFSWADEADSLPIHSVLPLPPPRDFSVLRSSSRSPFGSLQRRARRSHRADLHPPRPAFPSAPVITRRHPAGLRAGRPSIMQVSSLPSRFAVPPSPLSWDGDPRLVELSRVLQSLGWVRESFG